MKKILSIAALLSLANISDVSAFLTLAYGNGVMPYEELSPADQRAADDVCPYFTDYRKSGRLPYAPELNGAIARLSRGNGVAQYARLFARKNSSAGRIRVPAPDSEMVGLAIEETCPKSKVIWDRLKQQD